MTSTLTSLPLDVQNTIVAQLSNREAATLAQTCRSLKDVVGDNPAWDGRIAQWVADATHRPVAPIPAPPAHLSRWSVYGSLHQIRKLATDTLPSDTELQACSRARAILQSALPASDFALLATNLQNASLRKWQQEAPARHLDSYITAAARIAECRTQRTANLSLADLRIQSLPAALFWLTHVRQLNLSGTRLYTLPSGLACLVGLKALYLSKTRVSSLPRSLGSLEQLVNLGVAGTRMGSLPKNIHAMRRLKVLDAGSTKLRTLPAGMEEMLALTQIAVPACVNTGTLANLPTCSITYTK